MKHQNLLSYMAGPRQRKYELYWSKWIEASIIEETDWDTNLFREQ